MLYSFIGLFQSSRTKFWQVSSLSVLVMLGLLSSCTSNPESSSAPASPATETSSSTTPASTAATKTAKIDVNSAPIAELDKLELPGTKPSLSERIQGKRPYVTPDDLVTKKAISADEYKLIKDLIVVGQGK